MKLWNAVHIMSSIGRIAQPTPLEKLYLEVKKGRYKTLYNPKIHSDMNLST